MRRAAGSPTSMQRWVRRAWCTPVHGAPPTVAVAVIRDVIVLDKVVSCGEEGQARRECWHAGPARASTTKARRLRSQPGLLSCLSAQRLHIPCCRAPVSCLQGGQGPGLLTVEGAGAGAVLGAELLV